VAIGSSAGGPKAIEKILSDLNIVSVPLVITQHMPEVFTRAFAKRLNDLFRVNVREAAQGDLLAPGEVLIAPGNRHLRLVRKGERIAVRLSDEPPHNRHRPAVDLMFLSLVEAKPQAALGILLTGMGNDGARGLLAMHENGYQTAVQNEETSDVWGMPGEAVKLAAVRDDAILPLGAIAALIASFAAHQ
jgi:two-component system, chemotaxis family, protein-glutamate methylesterase/glutaminase